MSTDTMEEEGDSSGAPMLEVCEDATSASTRSGQPWPLANSARLELVKYNSKGSLLPY